MKNILFAVFFSAMLPGAAGVYGQETQLLETDLFDEAPAAAAPRAGLPDLKPKEPPKAGAPEKKTPAAAVKGPAVPSGKKKGRASSAPASPAGAGTALPAAVKPAAVVKPAASAAKPAAPAAASPAGGFSVEKKHTVSGGDTLWGLSGRYYGDPYKWGKIHGANLDTVADPDRIYPGEELTIPGITEEIKPARKTRPAISGADTVREGELSVTELNPAAAPAAAARREAAAAGAIREELSAFTNDGLSKEMPQDQTEWSASIKVVPENWTGDGFVSAKEKTGPDSADDAFSFNGETVVIRLSGQVPAPVKKGDYLTVYLRGSAAFDEQGKRIGRELQPAGLVEILSVDGRVAKGRVADASSSIRRGMVVKLGGR